VRNSRADAKEAARGDLELDAHAAGAGVDHVGHLRATLLQFLHDRADVRFLDVDDQPLVRLHRLPIDVLEDDLRPRQRELEALAAHVLREDRQMQLAASCDFEAVRLSGLTHAQRDVLA